MRKVISIFDVFIKIILGLFVLVVLSAGAATLFGWEEPFLFLMDLARGARDFFKLSTRIFFIYAGIAGVLVLVLVGITSEQRSIYKEQKGLRVKKSKKVPGNRKAKVKTTKEKVDIN